MTRKPFWVLGALILILPACTPKETVREPDAMAWRSHDMSRPRPQVVTPTGPSLQPPPPGAAILFDGDLSAWKSPNGDAAPWTVGDGWFEVKPGTGPIETRQSFGDVQMHVEWASPSPPLGTGQDRGNSGIFLMSRYEVQVLDSWNAETYADGQAGAIYGQYPPLFNASRAPGEWQSYDIYFRRPRFDSNGAVQEPARITLMHNGVVVQNNEAFVGPTSWLKPFVYEAHPGVLPIQLQDHGSPVRFRNMWVLPIPERVLTPTSRPPSAVKVSDQVLARVAGTYNTPDGSMPFVRIENQKGVLTAFFTWRPGPLELVPLSDTEFALKNTDATLVFEGPDGGTPTGVTFNIGGARIPGVRAEAR